MPKPSDKTLDLFVFVDALGWELVSKHGFLKEYLPHQNRCDTLFGYSCTCDPSIITGKQPSETGHFSFFAPPLPGEKSPFKWLKLLSFLPQRVAAYHRIRNRISRYLGKHLGYTGYFQLYSVPFKYLPYLDYTEKRDLYRPGGIISGAENVFREWERSGKPFFLSDWRLGDTKNLAQLTEKLNERSIEMAYLITGELDAWLHQHGIEGPEAGQGMRRFETKLKAVFDCALKNYKTVNLHVFGDHGMTQVHTGSDMMLRWEALGYRFGKDYIAVWDATMVRMWFLGNQEMRKRAEDFFAGESQGQLLDEKTLRKWGCYFEDHRYGELIFLLDPGVLFVPSFMNMGWVTGMHGYAPEDKDSAAAWLTNTKDSVKQLMDIYGVMLAACQRGGKGGGQ